MKRGFSRNFMLQVGLLVLVTQGVSPAPAQTRTWIGSVEPYWELPTNWFLPGVPLTNETILIGPGVPGARVDLNSAVTVANLDMSGSALLEDDPFVQYPPNPGGSGSLVVQSATKLIGTSRLTVLVRTGSLEMRGLSSVVAGLGASLEVEGEATLTSGATLQLLNDLKLSQSGGTSLRNDGTIDVRRAATIDAAFGSLIDLDGPGETGRVTIGPDQLGAGQGQLTIDGALSDPFDGQMDLTSGTQAPTLTMSAPWEATQTSVINLNRATIAGAPFTSSGRITVGAAVLPSTIAANVVMPRGTIDGGGSLVFEGTTTLTDEGLISVAVPVEFANVANIVGATVDGGSFTFSGATTITDATMTSDAFAIDGAATIGGASNIDVDSISLRETTSSLTIAAGDVGTRYLSNLNGGALSLEGGILRINGGGNALIGDLSFGSPAAPVFRVEEGSTVSSDGSWIMGVGPGNAGSTVVVGTDDDGSPSTLNTRRMLVGSSSTPVQNGSGILLVNGGGSVNVTDINPTVDGSLIIGSGSYSHGQVIVTGVSDDGLRSTLDVEGSITVAGGEPSFGSLEVNNGARVHAGGDILLAQSPSATPGYLATSVVSVGGDFGGFAPAELIADGDIRFSNGIGTLTINPGGRVEADEMTLRANSTVNLTGGELSLHGFDKESGGTFNHTGGTITLSGGDGVFNSGVAYDGPLGNVPTFTITDGADVAVTTYWQVGDAAGGHGITHVTGTNADGSRRSTLRGTSSGDLRVGDAGTGTLLIEDGGLVDLRDDTEIARGTVDSEGTVTVRGVADAGGNLIRSELRVTGNGSSSILNVARAGHGTLNIEDGALVRTSASANVGALAGSVGEINIGGAMSGFAAELDVAGAIRVGSSGTGTVNINDGGRVQADELIVWAGSEVNLNGGELSLHRLDVNTNGGIVHITGDSTYDVDQTDGNFDMEGGSITPGDSPGIMTVNGNYTTIGTTLAIEIGGLVAGTEFDRVEVTGTANIDGTLDVQLFDLGGDTFVPGEGDTFEIFSAAGGITGAFVFDTLTAPSLPAGLMWDVDYGTHDILLQVLAAFAAADFNEDGDVDINDLNAMLSQGPIAPGVSVTPGVNEQFDLNGDGTINLDDRDEWLADAATENGFGSAYKLGDANLDGVVDGQDFILWNGSKFTSSLLWDTGEFNGDGVVDGQDFIDWNGNKFTSSDGVSAVPEPGAGMLAVVAMFLLGAARRRRRGQVINSYVF